MIVARELAINEHARFEHLCRRQAGGAVWSTPSLAAHLGRPHIVVGCFRGDELVGGGTVYLADGGLARIVEGSPWQGLVSRSTHDEGERLEIADVVARFLLGRFGEATLTMPPEWTDVRAFTWLGMRTHVRYTYRGHGRNYEKRLRLRDVGVRRSIVHEHPSWSIVRYEADDGAVEAIRNDEITYYWRSTGTHHAECIDAMIREADTFDLVGCNSPQRGLFKRSFGGTLTPYYHVTTRADIPVEFLPPVEAAA